MRMLTSRLRDLGLIRAGEVSRAVLDIKVAINHI